MAKMGKPTLTVTPSRCLVDDKVRITLSGVNPGSKVTIASSLEERRMKFLAHAHYKADEHGSVDVTTHESLGGSYVGLKPMGLFWSMKEAPGQRPGLRIMKRDVERPLIYYFYVYHSHVDPVTDKCTEICGATAYRSYMADDVQQIEIRTGRIRGRLFLPPGQGPFPGVIDLFGSTGGLVVYRAALLASRGFATLSLAYFDYDDLPDFWNVELDYFEEAADWFVQQPFSNGKAALVATSHGAELGLVLSSFCPRLFSAIVSISGPTMMSISHTYKGTLHPISALDFSLMRTDEEGNAILKDLYVNQTGEARIKIENIRAPVLFVCGADDQNVSPVEEEEIAELERKYGKVKVTVRKYPGAGHLIELPYMPHYRVTPNRLLGKPCLWGGEPRAHAHCQESSWAEILGFLREHLMVSREEKNGNSNKISNSKL